MERPTNICGYGGIGRRAWFRSMFSQGSGGSSPLIRTSRTGGCNGRATSAPHVTLYRSSNSELRPTRGPPAVMNNTNDQQVSYAARIGNELHVFNSCSKIHDLPPIASYWSRKF